MSATSRTACGLSGWQARRARPAPGKARTTTARTPGACGKRQQGPHSLTHSFPAAAGLLAIPGATAGEEHDSHPGTCCSPENPCCGWSECHQSAARLFMLPCPRTLQVPLRIRAGPRLGRAGIDFSRCPSRRRLVRGRLPGCRGWLAPRAWLTRVRAPCPCRLFSALGRSELSVSMLLVNCEAPRALPSLGALVKSAGILNDQVVQKLRLTHPPRTPSRNSS